MLHNGKLALAGSQVNIACQFILLADAAFEAFFVQSFVTVVCCFLCYCRHCIYCVECPQG